MLSLVLLLSPAFAEVPLPAFPDCSEGNLAGCPNDLSEDDWDQVSWIPATSKATVHPSELAMGSGIALDVAWRRSTGRWDVAVAVIDSGIDWSSGSIARKVLLNVGELPLPQDASGDTAASHDLDGNGLVNISDYAEDPRVSITAGVDEADGMLDPSDLIYTFSDGIDGEGNGYIDDIAGWDFFLDDNDAYADPGTTFGSHGTGVMREAAQEGGDGGGGIGSCPNCAILPLRHGEAIITDGDRAGLAIAYATDQGARAIAMAYGALTHSTMTSEAIAHAEANGVVIVAAAGDENSYHHNLPAMHAPILYVHSIRGNNADERSGGTKSFLSFFNCNNYGPRIDVVAPSNGCATGAVSRISGAAALIVSAGLDHGVDLEASEVRALLRTTVDDIALTAAEVADVKTYPSKPGFDPFYGYGRTNIGRAVDRIFADEIPPIADITSPEWFDFAEGAVAVEGRVAAPRAGSVSWRLMVGAGEAPDDWHEAASGDGEVDGALATVDLSAYGTHEKHDLGPEGVVERSARAHEPLVTLKLIATDDEGRVTEDRRGVWVYDDPDLLSGFPIRLEGSGEPGATLADLDGDGVFEIVAPTGGGVVHAFHGDGTEMDGFPVHTSPGETLLAHAAAPAYSSGAVGTDIGETIVAAAAVGDIDGDGEPEIVVASYMGRLYAWNTDGSVVPGFPVRTVGRANEEFGEGDTWDQGIAGAPALGDVDGDGALEIVVTAMDQRVYVWNGEGALLTGYPLEVCEADLCGETGARIVASPALGDVDGDGDLDVVFGSNEVPRGAAGVLYGVDLETATVWAGYPAKRDGLINQAILPVIGEGHPSSVSLADLGGGGLAMQSNPMLGTSGPIDDALTEILEVNWVRDGFGAGSNVSTENAFLSLATNPSFGDLDQDGVPDLLTGGSGAYWVVSLAATTKLEYEHGLLAWSGATGEMFPGFPRQLEDVSFLNAPTVADVSGDGRPEAIYGTGGFYVYAWDADGELAEGWPKFTGGWLLGSASVGDVDGDGYSDVVASTREGWLFAWKTEGFADQEGEWPSARHDAANTGNYGTPLPTQIGPDLKGCCKKRKAKREEAAWLLLIPLLLLRRRR